LGCGLYPSISALQVIFWFEKQENVLIRALICGPKNPGAQQNQFGLQDLSLH
jgi:hypothetical protein